MNKNISFTFIVYILEIRCFFQTAVVFRGNLVGENADKTVADLERQECRPLGPISSIFIHFPGEIWPNNRLMLSSLSWCPPGNPASFIAKHNFQIEYHSFYNCH